MSNSVVLNEVEFAVPCRDFRIAYAVTTQSRLPCMTEFPLRLAAVCDGLTADTLHLFFGLGPRETTILVADLIQQKLLIQDGALLSLSQKVREEIQDSPDGVPRLAEVEARNRKVCFDLINFNLIRGGIEASRFAVNLGLSNDAQHRALDRVRDAFDSQYREWADLTSPYADRNEELYRVDDVRAEKPGARQVTAQFELDLQGAGVDVLMTVDSSEVTSKEDILTATISESLTGEPLARTRLGVAAFRQRFGNLHIGEYFEGDMPNYRLLAEDAKARLETRLGGVAVPLLGNLYTAQNIDVLEKALRGIRSVTSNADVPPPIWLAPELYTWGRTPLLAVLLEKVQEALGQEETRTTIKLPVDRARDDWPHVMRNRDLDDLADVEEANRRRPLFDGAAEVFLVPGHLVAVLYHSFLPQRPTWSIPFGFLSANARVVAQVTENLRDWV